MSLKPKVGFALGLLCWTMAAGLALGFGDHAKKIQFTTQSEEAKKWIREFVHAIESFAPPARLTEIAQKAAEADPEFAFGRYAVSVVATSPAQGQVDMEKALELAKNASDGERRYLEAMSLVRRQPPDLDGALAIFTKLRQDYPEERMALMLIGQIYSGQGKPEQAREAFEAAAKLDGGTPRVHTFLANIHLLEGDYAKARDIYAKARAAAADSAPFFAYAGPVYADLYEGKVDAALEDAEAYLEAYERTGGPQSFPSVFIWNMKARIALEHNRTEEALRCYKKGAATLEGSTLPEDQKQVWGGRYIHGTARTLAKMGRWDEARQEAAKIERMIEEGGEQANQYRDALHYLQGYLNLESGQYAQALDHLGQIQQPDDFQKALLARTYEKLGDNDKALQTYREILASGQNNLERALVYREARQKIEATTAG